MQVGISYIGIIMLILLFLPNIIFIKNRPVGWEKLGLEDRILGILEKIGQVGVTMICPISKNLNPDGFTPWTLWLIVSALCMALYEAWWIKYFTGKKRLRDFYSGILGIPLAGAVLPVLAFGFLAIFGKSPQLALFVIPLGIGHIGIHKNHKKEISGIDFEEDNNVNSR